MFLSIGSIIIDDIILPDGKARMGMLGGGAVHAAVGMRWWSDSVGIVAGVGRDFPAELADQLMAVFRVEGVVRKDLPTPRAWQLFEPDGHRSEVFRTPYADFRAINPEPDEVPPALLAARGVHLQPEAPDPLRSWVKRLRTGGAGFLLWEPWDIFCQPENYALFCELMRSVDAVSPNLEEARMLTGLDDPEQILAELLADGAQLVALRMGAQGSLVARPGGPLLRVPAVPVQNIVDVTGAGNAYCGGFVVGMVETGDPAQAARYAAVSASFALEQFGALIPLEGRADRRRQRLDWS